MIERYTLPEMGAIWSQQNKFQKWLDVEIAVCEVHAEDGTIPADAVEEMIYKEENILLPMSQNALTDDEWGEIWQQTPEYGYCLVDPREEYQPPTPTDPTTPTPTLPPVVSSSSGGGGGCTIGNDGRFDPTLPAMLFAGLGFLGWRRYKAGK